MPLCWVRTTHVIRFRIFPLEIGTHKSQSVPERTTFNPTVTRPDIAFPSVDSTLEIPSHPVLFPREPQLHKIRNCYPNWKESPTNHLSGNRHTHNRSTLCLFVCRPLGYGNATHADYVNQNKKCAK